MENNRQEDVFDLLGDSSSMAEFGSVMSQAFQIMNATNSSEYVDSILNQYKHILPETVDNKQKEYMTEICNSVALGMEAIFTLCRPLFNQLPLYEIDTIEVKDNKTYTLCSSNPIRDKKINIQVIPVQTGVRIDLEALKNTPLEKEYEPFVKHSSFRLLNDKYCFRPILEEV